MRRRLASRTCLASSRIGGVSGTSNISTSWLGSQTLHFQEYSSQAWSPCCLFCQTSLEVGWSPPGFQNIILERESLVLASSDELRYCANDGSCYGLVWHYFSLVRPAPVFPVNMRRASNAKLRVRAANFLLHVCSPDAKRCTPRGIRVKQSHRPNMACRTFSTPPATYSTGWPGKSLLPRQCYAVCGAGNCLVLASSFGMTANNHI